MFDVEKELKKLPAKPGVYIMHDKDDNIIYVGKAVVLKNRVRQYFRKNNKTQRIQNMVALIDHFEYIVCESEAEALILECNLIKKNMPKFNVLLKDDKTYPYIKINLQADYPDVYITRRILNDGAKYFGPYANAGSAKEIVDFIKSRYKIRQCKSFKYKDRPCLNYHIKKCMAPCMGYVTKEEYRKQIKQIIAILEGKTEELVKQLKQEMNQAAKELKFEQAQDLRDKIYAIDAMSQRQKVSNISENDIDVIGIARNEIEVCVEMFYIRNSKMVDRKHYFFKGLNDEEDKEILSSFLKQFYLGRQFFPSKIMIREEIEDKQLIEETLTSLAGRKVEIKTPQKGEKLRLVEMTEQNAKITLDNKEKDKYNILKELKEVLQLETIPRKIECYDISNLSGTNMVAGMCVMQDGIIKKNLSRRFKIKEVIGQDDPACMEEVVSRRLRHSVPILNEDKPNGFGDLPDVIFADGGITQIHAIQQAIKKVNKEIEAKAMEKGIEITDKDRINVAVFGMVKNDKHQTRALMNDRREELEISQTLLNTITMFQDAVHDTAIGYHKKLRNEGLTKSALDNIKGIGTAKKVALLKKYGSVEKIKDASVDDIAEVKGINKELAQQIKDNL
ncbi:MAG: excinuclease ABC subunit UvrC [Christensenellales bacterium]